MTIVIVPKKPFTDYSEAEQQAILSKGQAILSQKLEQGESRSPEDTFCMLAYQRSQREVKFKPTVEKIVKEKALTKAQKIDILEQVVKLGDLSLTDKQQQVVDELVGKDKEYWIFTFPEGDKHPMKMTKTNIKKKLKFLENELLASKLITASEQEFLTAMTGETNE